MNLEGVPGQASPLRPPLSSLNRESGVATSTSRSINSPSESGGASSGGGGGAALEAELLRRAQAGDRLAFGQFVLSTQQRLYTVLVRILGDREEAKETAQEAYLKALVALPDFRHGSAPYTWLYRIGVNLAVSRLRKVRRTRTFSLDSASHAPSSDAPGDEHLLRRERDKQVIAALGRLDAEYRAMLVMRDVDGLDYKEISDILALPLGTVKSRLFRARLALREELSAYMTFPRPTNSSSSEGGLQ